MLEALFALCRKAVENEPLKIFMALSDLDRNRATPLEAGHGGPPGRASITTYGSAVLHLQRIAQLSATTIVSVPRHGEAINKIRDQLFRVGCGRLVPGAGRPVADPRAAGRRFPTARPTRSSPAIARRAFAQVRNDRELFDAGRNGVKALLAAGTGRRRAAAQPQDRMMDLLAGAAEPKTPKRTTRSCRRSARILEAQRIISLDTLFELADHLDSLSARARS